MTANDEVAERQGRLDMPETGAGPDHHLRPRWDGRPGRLEIWYTTLTDPSTGTGFWIHHELLAPTSRGPARAYGWLGVFAPESAPELYRFGPQEWACPDGTTVFTANGATLTSRGAELSMSGAAGIASWDLTGTTEQPALFTFPRWAWRREILPAAQILAQPGQRFTGAITAGTRRYDLDDAWGGTARIYGNGNAKRWVWLHADLGSGDVLEVVAAVSKRPGLSLLPLLPLLRLRLDGEDLPAADPLLTALRLRARIEPGAWTVEGPIGRRKRIRIRVALPAAHTLTVDYTDPDGSTVLCHNSERADAHIIVERGGRGRWTTEREWRLDGTAHAEIGERA